MIEQDQIENQISVKAHVVERLVLSKFQRFELFSLAIGAALAATSAFIAAVGGIGIPLAKGWSVYVADYSIAGIGIVLLLAFLFGWTQFMVRLKRYSLGSLGREIAWFFSAFILGLSLATTFVPSTTKPIRMCIEPPDEPYSVEFGYQPTNSPFKYCLILRGLKGGNPGDIGPRTYTLPAAKPPEYDSKQGALVFPSGQKYSCSGDVLELGFLLLVRSWANNGDTPVSPNYFQSHCSALTPGPPLALPMHRLTSQLLQDLNRNMRGSLPEDALQQANAQLALAEKQGFTSDDDVVFFALNNLTLPAGWAKHPAARKCIRQAISGQRPLAESFRQLDYQSLREIYGE